MTTCAFCLLLQTTIFNDDSRSVFVCLVVWSFFQICDILLCAKCHQNPVRYTETTMSTNKMAAPRPYCK